MLTKSNKRSAVSTLAILILLALAATVWAGGFSGGHNEALGPLYEAAQVQEPPPRQDPPGLGDPARRIRYWNEIALTANALDHTPVEPGDDRIFGEQIGPGRTSRAFAIIHIAIFDAVNAIAGGYQSYTRLAPARTPTSMDAAIAQAAHDTLVVLFPSQKKSFDRLLVKDLGRIPDG